VDQIVPSGRVADEIGLQIMNESPALLQRRTEAYRPVSDLAIGLRSYILRSR
jgi:hypothetical protein